MINPFPSLSRLESSIGMTMVTRGIPGPIGSLCRIETASGAINAEVVGFRSNHQAILMPLGPAHSLAPGAAVIGVGETIRVPHGHHLLGRMVDALGRSLNHHPIAAGKVIPLTLFPIPPHARQAITRPWVTGVKVIDTLLTLGQGQRVGLFAGAGVGKTTLLQQILDYGQYDHCVIALIGERGREVHEFWSRLSVTARQKIILVVATSDQPPLLRLRALDTAIALARSIQSPNTHTLLLVDSMTRVGHALREVGLAAGEPPSVHGYPPSLLARLPQWIEQSGALASGTITALFTVLLDGDDPSDPIADTLRGLLDGNIYLDRARAERHHFPAIDPIRSLSRVQSDLLTPEQWTLVGQARQILATAEDYRDLVAIGAYKTGVNPQLDDTLAQAQTLKNWLIQGTQPQSPAQNWQELRQIIEPGS